MSAAPNRTTAVVREVLPNAMFRIEVRGGRLLRAHVARDARAVLTRLVAGDVVLVEATPSDPGEWRIVGRPPGVRAR